MRPKAILLLKQIILAVVAALTAIAGCSRVNTVQNGPGTEVIGYAAIPGNPGPVHGTVFLRKSDFLADTAGRDAPQPRTFTDAAGKFSFSDVQPGTYVIEVRDTSQVAQRLAVVIPAAIPSEIRRVSLDTGFLTPTGTINGYVQNPTAGTYVQVYGLQQMAPVDPATGAFSLPDMPKGGFVLRVVSASPASVPYTIDTTRVLSGDTTSVPFAGWRHSKRLYLNTTASGADIKENVIHFPLLVRLDLTTFVFSQAHNSGQDLRFTKEDGSPLAYQIESWDPGRSTAAVWVRIDTVYANSSTQFIVMWWGGGNAGSQSSGGAVFDTADGYAGVWHLDESGNGSKAEFRDATYNVNHGQGGDGSDSTIPRRQPGLIGYAQEFDGKYAHIDCGNGRSVQLRSSAISMEAWVKLDATQSTWGGIISKAGYTGGYRMIVGQDQYVGYQLTGELHSILNSGPLTLNQWHHIVSIYNGATMQIFIDGVKDSREAPRTGQIDSTDCDLMIGLGDCIYGSITSYPFIGLIDEARVSRVARSAAWIKLSYANQSGGNGCIVFGK